MSKSWAKGSTRRWRKLRQAVLERDNERCQVIVNAALGLRCDRRATTAGHLIPRAHGGKDRLDNLQAECTQHNYGDGTRIARAGKRDWLWIQLTLWLQLCVATFNLLCWLAGRR